MVILAAGMCVLLAFGALAVDMSTLYLENTRLQTALDAGVLAGASLLPDKNAAIAEARTYIESNGILTDGISFSFENGDMVITAQAAQEVEAGFSRVMGYEAHTVSAAASAEKYRMGAGGVFDYLLFTGDPGYELFMGGRFDIGGSVHANGRFRASPERGVIQGAAEACGTVYCNPSTMTAGSQVPGADFIEMPDFTSVVQSCLPPSYSTHLTPEEVVYPWWNQAFTGTTYVSGNCVVRNQCTVDGVLYVDGDLTISGGDPVCVLNGTIYVTGNIVFNNTFNGTGNVFAGGNIKFKGNGLKLKATDSVCVYSQNGSIEMVARNTTVTGIVYAPKGNIKIEGDNTTFFGNIIGNRVTGVPANLVMRVPEEPLSIIGAGKEATRLIR